MMYGAHMHMLTWICEVHIQMKVYTYLGLHFLWKIRLGLVTMPFIDQKICNNGNKGGGA